MALFNVSLVLLIVLIQLTVGQRAAPAGEDDGKKIGDDYYESIQ